MTPARVLVTGHDGYIGQVLVPMLQEAGHDVVGLDSFYFEDCIFPGEPQLTCPAIRKDIRDVTIEDVAGFDAVMHLAGLSNDPLGDFEPEATYEINHRASVHLARLAKAAGVGRYIFSSSCSNYGAAGDDYLDETASFNPVTPYAESKVWVERDVSAMADDDFSPTFLRNATAYGISAKLRGDLVVNNLTGYAFTTGAVLIKSDGMPWRPLVHIEDIALAFKCVLEAPRDRIHNQAFNVGATQENYRVRQVADMVEEIVPGSKVSYANDASPDSRNYRVNCDKIQNVIPLTALTVRAGIEQIYAAYRDQGLTEEDFLGHRYQRIRHAKNLVASGRLDSHLRWQKQAA